MARRRDNRRWRVAPPGGGHPRGPSFAHGRGPVKRSGGSDSRTRRSRDVRLSRRPKQRCRGRSRRRRPPRSRPADQSCRSRLAAVLARAGSAGHDDDGTGGCADQAAGDRARQHGVQRAVAARPTTMRSAHVDARTSSSAGRRRRRRPARRGRERGRQPAGAARRARRSRIRRAAAAPCGSTARTASTTSDGCDRPMRSAAPRRRAISSATTGADAPRARRRRRRRRPQSAVPRAGGGRAARPPEQGVASSGSPVLPGTMRRRRPVWLEPTTMAAAPTSAPPGPAHRPVAIGTASVSDPSPRRAARGASARAQLAAEARAALAAHERIGRIRADEQQGIAAAGELSCGASASSERSDSSAPTTMVPMRESSSSRCADATGRRRPRHPDRAVASSVEDHRGRPPAADGRRVVRS